MNNNRQQLTFSEVELQSLFGHEAAEDEDLERLRKYYFKSSTYDQVVNDLPLRILVGHKGIGKSALFQVAMAEEADAKRITVLIKPDDIVGLGADTSDFLKTIRDWKLGISEIIAKKVLSSMGIAYDGWRAALNRYGGFVLDFMKDTFSGALDVSAAPANKLLVDQFLKTGKISVYIDDLDRGWQGKKEDIIRISALLNAIRDISTENRGILFRVSLRSDVYYLVRTSDESTDKIEGSVIWHSWTNQEVFILLIKRIESFFGRELNDEEAKRMQQYQLAALLRPVFEERFSGKGHWENAPMFRVLMSLIRKRPRDLVKLCTLAGRNAREQKAKTIGTKNLEAIFPEYSQGRLQDTINEFRSELPAIEKLLLGMKPSKKEKQAKQGYVYTTDKLLKKLRNIMEQGDFRFANGESGDAKRLAAFLYKINFITARKETESGIIRQYFEENRYLSNEFVEFGFDWEIHPAYRWALQPDDINEIYASLQLGK
jgi:hypothetical protein